MRSLLLVVVLCIGITSIVQATSPSLPESSNSWDLFFWPGQGGTPLPTNIKGWTIHGLWPERDDGTWPQFCNPDAPFDINQVSDLVPTMQIQWIDDEEPNNSSALWSHEWDKHGTCAVNLPALATQHDFFSQVLNIHSQDTLASAGITPSNSKSYPIYQYVDPVKAKYGVSPIFNCEQMNGHQVLEQVVFCVNTTLQFIECNSKITSSLESQAPCGQSVYYPPIEYQRQFPLKPRNRRQL